MANTEKANQVLKDLVSDFKTGNVIEKMAKMPLIKDPNDDRPCWNWSPKNRYLMVSQGTFDARNATEWQKVGRNPKNWSQTVRILQPRFSYSHNENDCSGMLFYNKKTRSYDCQKCKGVVKGIQKAIEDGKAKSRVIGYGCTAEWAVENTYGKDLPEYKPSKKPELIELAEKWGIKIKYQIDPTFGSLGHTNAQTDDEDPKIVLGTEDKSVFFHELIHQADKRVQGKNLRGGQDPQQEIVAQLGACVLSKIYGHDVKYESYKYIERYAKKQKLSIEKAVDKVLSRMIKIIDFIFNEYENLQKQTPEIKVKTK